jgi:hypothetical protein
MICIPEGFRAVPFTYIPEGFRALPFTYIPEGFRAVPFTYIPEGFRALPFTYIQEGFLAMQCPRHPSDEVGGIAQIYMMIIFGFRFRLKSLSVVFNSAAATCDIII